MPFDPAATFLARSRYYLGLEYPGKIRLALSAMPESELWHRPNASSNSAGNLVLHLAGNVRQWIVSGVGGAPDVRARDAEFAAPALMPSPCSTASTPPCSAKRGVSRDATRT